MKLRYLLPLLLLILHFQFSKAQCPNNNNLETSFSSPGNGYPETLFLLPGRYVTVQGMNATRTYAIAASDYDGYDPQITIYPSSGGNAVAYNDDYDNDAPGATIYFTPPVSGDYDILVDGPACSSSAFDEVYLYVGVAEDRRDIITIPTVVHVVYNNATENITVAQIHSQITALNKDFSASNADLANVPARFRGFSKDTRIQFCLASVSPSNTLTTGITRTSTTHGPFSPSNDEMKMTAMGGKDAWPRDSYMNIWVGDVVGSTLGYAQFPGLAAATDGIVVDYLYFGTTGTATAPFNLGRTTTHEVGHWLNLRHIWGDDGTACTGGDGVADTPNQAGSSSGCPTNNPTSCNNATFGGDMYPNYMDYSDDACLSMFTYYQNRRMRTAIIGSRSSLRTSLGCAQSVSQAEPQQFVLEVHLFPNPAKNQVTVSVQGELGKSTTLNFTLYDMFGKPMLVQRKIHDSTFQVDTSVLPAGIYFYAISSQSGASKKGRLVIL